MGGGGVTVFCPCFPSLCLTDGGDMIRSQLGCPQNKWSLGWNSEGGGAQTGDNDPRSSAMKRLSYKFIYLLSADPGCELARRGEPGLTRHASACHNIEANVKEEE